MPLPTEMFFLAMCVPFTMTLPLNRSHCTPPTRTRRRSSLTDTYRLGICVVWVSGILISYDPPLPLTQFSLIVDEETDKISLNAKNLEILQSSIIIDQK
jgi:hypothetical protein